MLADVAVIIIAYNSERQLGGCLTSLINQRRTVSQQIIVLDNASHDQSAELVQKQFPDVALLRSDKNLGFAGGVNFAVRHANAELILLLNPDTVILDHAVDVIVEFARNHPGHGLYGGRTFRPDGSLEPSSCWGLPSLWSLTMFASGLSTVFARNSYFDPESLGHWKRDTVRQVGVVTGCFLLTLTRTWEQLGGLDERFFMYGEDVDLAIRAHAVGYKPLICPDARLTHEVGQSSDIPAHKALLLFRGKATLIHLHWDGFTKWIGLQLLKSGVGIRAAVVTVRGYIVPSEKDNRWSVLWSQRDLWLAGYENSTNHIK